MYFGGDHVVWASQAGIYTNKEVIDRVQKVSLWAWFGASTCTIVNELTELANMRRTRVLLPGEVRGAAAVRPWTVDQSCCMLCGGAGKCHD